MGAYKISQRGCVEWGKKSQTLGKAILKWKQKKLPMKETEKLTLVEEKRKAEYIMFTKQRESVNR